MSVLISSISTYMERLQNNYNDLSDMLKAMIKEHNKTCAERDALNARVRELEEALRSVIAHTQAHRRSVENRGPILKLVADAIAERALLTSTAPASEDKPVCDKCNDTGAVDWGTGVSECPDCRHWGIGERKTNAEGEQQ